MSTKIEWCEETWNPVTGCTAVSAGCENCYARRRAKMLAKNTKIAHPERYEDFKVSLHSERLDEPLHWKKPRRVFVCSMGDLFHEDVPDAFICQVWNIIRHCQASNSLNHTFIVLTKRERRMADFVRRVRFDSKGSGRVFLTDNPEDHAHAYCLGADHKGCTGLTNLWLGVSVENQPMADKRIPILLQIPAAVRFVSVEPMLEPVHIKDEWFGWREKRSYRVDRQLHWIICGAETGPGARDMGYKWPHNLRDQCIEAGVPFFFKKYSDGDRELSGRLWEQYPERSES